jgi:hypothetical protein
MFLLVSFRNLGRSRGDASQIQPMNFTEIDREDFRNLLHEISEAYMPYGKYGPESIRPVAFL